MKKIFSIILLFVSFYGINSATKVVSDACQYEFCLDAKLEAENCLHQCQLAAYQWYKLNCDPQFANPCPQ